MKKTLCILLSFGASQAFSSLDFLEVKILEYSSKNCSDEFTYRMTDLQRTGQHVHYIYELKDKKELGRERYFNNAGFSFKLKDSRLIEVTCPAKDQSILGNSHHFEID